MSATKNYFIEQIAGSVSKALGVPVSGLELINDNKIQILVSIEGDGAETPFWKAVLEHYEHRQAGILDRSLPVQVAPEKTVNGH
jgi:hypothetical protein